MKIELKNVKTFEGHDGVGLNADIFVDGIKTAHYHDGAYGGGGELSTFNREKMKQLEKWISEQPQKDYGTFKAKYDIDDLVNDLFAEKEKEKENKKLAKLYATKFVWGKPNGASYKSWGFKSNTPLVGLTKTGHKDAVQQLYDRTKSELKEGETIWNTNLAEMGLIL